MRMAILGIAAALAISAPVAASTVISPGAGTTGQAGLYPAAVSVNTTGQADSIFLGPPDDTYWGLGGQTIIFDLGVFRLIDLDGIDFNVYEVDFGIVEPGLITVGVSSDGSDFFDVTSTRALAINLAGDEAHGNGSFRYGYDISGAASAGYSDLRFIRIDGAGTGPSGFQTGFDLDAIGIANFSAVPEPSTWAMLLLGFGFIGSAMRFSRRRQKLSVSFA